MKRRLIATLPVMALLCFTLPACHKDNNDPPAIAVLPADTIANGKPKIDLSINGPQANWNFTKQYELIFSELYASPDSVSLQPLTLLTAQKSKLLQGQSLSSLTLKAFQYENVQGYGYAGFLGLTCDTVLLGTTRVVSAISYAKSF